MTTKGIGKSVLKVTAFIVMLCLAVSGANALLKSKHSHGIEPMEVFYTQPENSIDVLFLGSSHVFFDVNTGALWDEYGIAAYDLGGSVQPLWNTYYYLKEALKTQRPKLIVLDTFRTTELRDELDHAQVYTNTFGLRPSFNKIQAVSASTTQEGDYLLGMPIYHDRYSELTRRDFLNIAAVKDKDSWKGFLPQFGLKTRASNPDFGAVTDQEDMTAKSREYLVKIIELVKEEGIPLLLVSAPYVATDDELAVYNTVAEIAEEYNVPFIRQDQYFDELGFDFTGAGSDLSDSNHLNAKGAEKYTSYLGDYIKTNYEIPDRRGEEGYESWQIDADNIRAQIADRDISATNDFASWFDKVKDEDRFTLVLNFSNDARGSDELASVIAFLRDRGPMLTDKHLSSGFVAILQGGKVIKESISPRFVWHESLFSGKLMVEGAGSEAIIRFNYARYPTIEDGITAFLYDDLTGNLVEVSAWPDDDLEAKEAVKAS